MGRNSYWPLKYGATGGVAVDIDERSLESARRNLKPFPGMRVMRASVYDLPFEDRFDFAFSIGVVHHLEYPQRALERMVRAVKPDGRVLIWVYGRENNRWLVSVLDPFRRVLFSRLPIGALIRTIFRERCRDVLLSQANPVSDWFDRTALEALLDEHLAGGHDHGKKLGALYILFAVAAHRATRRSPTDAVVLAAAP